jgi:hypothetical protein
MMNMSNRYNHSDVVSQAEHYLQRRADGFIVHRIYSRWRIPAGRRIIGQPIGTEDKPPVRTRSFTGLSGKDINENDPFQGYQIPTNHRLFNRR